MKKRDRIRLRVIAIGLAVTACFFLLMRGGHTPGNLWHAWRYSLGAHNISAQKNGPVRFYGKITNEEGEPLEGVFLTAQLSWSEPSFVKALITGKESHTKDIHLTTDADGLFKMENGMGRRLTICNFEKEGYEIFGEKEFKGMAPRKSWGFSFISQSSSSHQPDPDRPVIFTMRRKM